MASLLSNLADNLGEEIHKVKCEFGHDNEKCETCGTKCKNYNCYLKYTNLKDGLIEKTCLCCNKNYQKLSAESLKKRFVNTFKFSNHDANTFFCCCKKVFTHINTCMIGKNSMKHSYLRKKIVTVT